MKYHRLCLLILCSITNAVLCAEAHKFSTGKKSAHDLNNLQNAVTQSNLNELDKFDFIMKLFENDSFSTLIEYKRNVRNMFEIIENNRFKESTNDKLTKIIKSLKIELWIVTNEYSQENYLQFLKNSVYFIDGFIKTFCDKDNNSDAIFLLSALEKLVPLLENVDKLMSIIEEFCRTKRLNLRVLKSKNSENELKHLKDLVDKLSREFEKYMDFRQENYNCYNTEMIYQIIKLKTYFNNANDDILTMNDDDFEALSFLLKDDLLMTISEFYERLNDYYDEDFLLLSNVLGALDNVWKFIMNFIETSKSYKN